MPASLPRPEFTTATNDQALYSLKDAAGTLHIEAKTLRKRIRALGIVPTPDPVDKRARLLTSRQLRQISNDSTHDSNQGGPGIAYPGTASPSSALEHLVLEIIKDRSRQLDERSSDLDRRERVLDEKEAALVKQIGVLTEMVRSTQISSIARPRYPARRHIRDQSARRTRHTRLRSDDPSGVQRSVASTSVANHLGDAVHAERAR